MICQCLLAIMGYPNYARNRACALPSPSPVHYVMARIVPAMQLGAHTKSSTLHRRPYGVKSNFFRLDGWLLFCLVMGLRERCDFSAVTQSLTWYAGDKFFKRPTRSLGAPYERCPSSTKGKSKFSALGLQELACENATWKRWHFQLTYHIYAENFEFLHNF